MIRVPCNVVAVLVLGLVISKAQAQKTWYVDRINCNAGNQKGTEERPFCAISTAIDAAQSGDTILVKPATYLGTVDFLGKEVLLKSTDGPDVTILDGNALQNVVAFTSGEGAGAVLEGFTVTGGIGRTTSSFLRAGGGILCENSSPTLKHNVIQGNEAMWGGGIMLIQSDALLIQNIIRDNVTKDSHGDEGPEHLTGAGAGMMAFNCSPTLIANVFSKNLASLYGGGIHFQGDQTGTPNTPKMYGNLLADNIAADFGGGLSVLFDMEIEFNGNTVAQNVGEGAFSSFSGGGLALVGPDSRVNVDSSIFYGDFDLVNNMEIFIYDGRVDIDYSNLEGGQARVEVQNGGVLKWNAGNVSVDPMFIDALNGNYHVDDCSPMTGAGNPAYVVAALETDIDGLNRIANGRVDMGADETESPCAGCSGNERIASAKCKSGQTLVVKLKGGRSGDGYSILLSGGETANGTLNAKGAAKEKFKGVSQASGTADATWGCGASDQATYGCS